MNLLVFNLERDFCDTIKLVANNEVDLENHLIDLGFKDIRFDDLRTDYGTCSLKFNQHDRETAKCFYVTKV